jgi:hypothetical protein
MVQAFGSFTPFTIAVLNVPTAGCWHAELVQFKVFPQALLDTVWTVTLAVAEGLGEATAVAVTVSVSFVDGAVKSPL